MGIGKICNHFRFRFQVKRYLYPKLESKCAKSIASGFGAGTQKLKVLVPISVLRGKSLLVSVPATNPVPNRSCWLVAYFVWFLVELRFKNQISLLTIYNRERDWRPKKIYWFACNLWMLFSNQYNLCNFSMYFVTRTYIYVHLCKKKYPAEPTCKT